MCLPCPSHSWETATTKLNVAKVGEDGFHVKVFQSDVCCFPVETWSVAFSPDSQLIATGSHSGKVNLIGVESGKKESVLDTRGKFTMSIAYVSIIKAFLHGFSTVLRLR